MKHWIAGGLLGMALCACEPSSADGGGGGGGAICSKSCDKSVECFPDQDLEACKAECEQVVTDYPDCDSQFSDCADCTVAATCAQLASNDPPCQAECEFTVCTGG